MIKNVRSDPTALLNQLQKESPEVFSRHISRGVVLDFDARIRRRDLPARLHVTGVVFAENIEACGVDLIANIRAGLQSHL